MNRFTLVRLPTLAQAAERVAQAPDARELRAGGIDLFDRMKAGVSAPDQLVELRAIADGVGQRMRGVSAADDGAWTLGALVTLGQLEGFDDLPAGHAALREAAASAATPGIRNSATLGGNLLQRPRCWYFRHSELDCLKKGGAECLAQSGRNRYNAILGGGPSWIVHPSSLAVALLALDATVAVARKGGAVRDTPLGDLFQLPTVDPEREHTLGAGEVLVAVGLPAAADAQRSTYVAAKEKQSHDWPLAEAAVRVDLAGGKMTNVRVALGHVAPIPWRAKEAEQLLEGKQPDEKLFAQAADAALAPAKPLSENAYKVPLAKGVLRQALHGATGVALPE